MKRLSGLMSNIQPDIKGQVRAGQSRERSYVQVLRGKECRYSYPYFWQDQETLLIRLLKFLNIVYLAVLIMSLIALFNTRNGSKNTQNVNKASSLNDSHPDDTTESTGGKRQGSSDTSPRINAQKKSKEVSPEVNFDIVASVDQGEVPNEETPSEMAAILETDQPPWVSAVIKQLRQVNHALEDIKEMKNGFTKLTNSFVNFKMEMVYKINQMEESVKKFCSNQYDEFHKTKGSLIQRLDKLEKENNKLETKLTKAVALIDDQQQYSRRNCLLFHRVNEESSEDTDNIVTEICAEKLCLEVDKSMIDRSHRIGPKQKDQKPRPMIVKLCSYRDRNKVFYNKKMLKGSGVTITEGLTKTRMDLLNEVQRIVGQGNSWTIDGNIFVKKGKNIVRISKRSEAESLMEVESDN